MSVYDLLISFRVLFCTGAFMVAAGLAILCWTLREGSNSADYPCATRLGVGLVGAGVLFSAAVLLYRVFL